MGAGAGLMGRLLRPPPAMPEALAQEGAAKWGPRAHWLLPARGVGSGGQCGTRASWQKKMVEQNKAQSHSPKGKGGATPHPTGVGLPQRGPWRVGARPSASRAG